MQVHACMLALRTGRPVKMVYSREESFFGHVHRHPARMRYEHGADAGRPARLRPGRDRARRRRVRRRPRRRSSPTPRRSARARTSVPNVADRRLRRLHQQPAVRGDARLRRGAGRASRYESQMDRLAEAVGLDPVEIRMRNALSEGRPVRHRAGARLAARRSPSWSAGCRDLPLPAAGRRRRPRGAARRRRQHHARRGRRRGVGYGVGIKNICFSEGFDDYSTARVRWRWSAASRSSPCTPPPPRSARAWSPSQAQIARTELGRRRR